MLNLTMGIPIDRPRTLEAEASRLPRKEVIQPQLPLRLPCYDFVPITNPTLGDYLPKGWHIDFRCYQLS
jgi:hypothetical protein